MRETYSSYEGVTPAFQEAMKWKTRVGRFISDADVEHATSICVLGQDIVNELFGDEEAMFGSLTNDEASYGSQGSPTTSSYGVLKLGYGMNALP